MTEKKEPHRPVPFHEQWNFNPWRYRLPIAVLPWVVPAAVTLATFATTPVFLPQLLVLPLMLSAGYAVSRSFAKTPGINETLLMELTAGTKADPAFKEIADKLFKRAGLPYEADVRHTSIEGISIYPYPLGSRQNVVPIFIHKDMRHILRGQEFAAVIAHEIAHLKNKPPQLNRNSILAMSALMATAFYSPLPIFLSCAGLGPLLSFVRKRFDEDRADYNSLGLFPHSCALNNSLKNLTGYDPRHGYFEPRANDSLYTKGFRGAAHAALWLYENVGGNHTPTGKRLRLVDKAAAETKEFYDKNGLSRKDARASILAINTPPLRSPADIAAFVLLKKRMPCVAKSFSDAIRSREKREDHGNRIPPQNPAPL